VQTHRSAIRSSGFEHRRAPGIRRARIPPEDAAALIREADAVLDEIEDLIRRINRTNATSEMPGGGTITDAIARRDVIKMRHALYTSAADWAAGRGGSATPRQLRSELRQLTNLPVGELRTRADDLARDHRVLDTAIQQRNWEVDLTD
jgi:hypothetical protein